MTENTAASAPGPSAGSADWKAYALRLQSELAALKADVAAAGKELPDFPKFTSRMTQEEIYEIESEYLGILHQSAIAILAAREATIRELEAKCAGMEGDAERWRKLLTLICGYSGAHYTIKIPATNYHHIDFSVAFTEAIDDARAADGGVK